MSTIRCKMVCDNKTKNREYYSHKTIFRPVYHNDDPNHENSKFWEATPSGVLELDTSIEMNVEVDKEYYIDINPAPVETSEN